MNGAQVCMGLIMICGSVLGYRHETLILSETGYGHWLRRLCGEGRARLVYRFLLIVLAGVGVSFVTNLVRPIRW